MLPSAMNDSLYQIKQETTRQNKERPNMKKRLASDAFNDCLAFGENEPKRLKQAKANEPPIIKAPIRKAP